MAIIEGDEISQLWGLITELSEQLNQNRSASVSLYAQAGSVKSQALHSQTGFVLRKFNSDLPRDVYESELERMNAAMTAENQSLQHDNKQLNTLIKEYEQTLDTLMSTFRNRAQTVQENELSLIRHYESNLLQLEEDNSSKELEASTRISESISRMSEVLRNCLREVGGERTSSEGGEEDLDLLEREPWQSTEAAHAEWALEREIELARLERENEELRALIMAGQTVPKQATALPSLPPSQPQPPAEPEPQSSEEPSINGEAEIQEEEDKKEEPVGYDLGDETQPEPEPQSQEPEIVEPEPETIPETNVDPYATIKRSNTGS